MSVIKVFSQISDEKQNISEIANKSGLSHGYTSINIKKLEKRGLIKRVFGGNCTYIMLSEDGKELQKLILLTNEKRFIEKS